MAISEVYNIDCMEYMKNIPDKFFNLAIVDPQYGIGEDGKSNHSRSKLAKAKQYTPKHWDNEPMSPQYFKELFRVSKNQIIWGANHFITRINKDSPCWIVWDKDNGANDFADCELAFTSFPNAVRKFKYRWHGMLQENMKNKEIRIHPTQKPVDLSRKCGYFSSDTFIKNGYGCNHPNCYDGVIPIMGNKLVVMMRN